jgi:hypothetical protein
MDLGKIMIGIALVLLSACLLVSPSHATGSDWACMVGCGNATSPADATVTPYSPWEREYPAGFNTRICGRASHENTMTLPIPAIETPSFRKEPRTV